MLKKLLKHEWKETWRIPALACALMIILTLVSVICFTRMSPPANADELNAGAFVLMMFYVLTISCVSVVVSIYIAVRFYKNLYTDEVEPGSIVYDFEPSSRLDPYGVFLLPS